MTIDFNPNRPPPISSWATYIPDRNPQFKPHKTRGHALNAFHYRDRGILYKWDLSKWVEIYKQGDPLKKGVCMRCGMSTVKESMYGHAPAYYSGRTMWVDKDTDNPRRIWVCRSCEKMVK